MYLAYCINVHKSVRIEWLNVHKSVIHICIHLVLRRLHVSQIKPTFFYFYTSKIIKRKRVNTLKKHTKTDLCRTGHEDPSLHLWMLHYFHLTKAGNTKIMVNFTR